jgi:UDP-2,4-diacetamido-2,4,6-trideoxy-beta-L-altropyranose hydrolase
VNQRVILRADANATIGFGHLYRLLALADILAEKFSCVFAINRPDEFAKVQIAKAGIPVIEINSNHVFVVPDQITPENQAAFDLQGLVYANDIVVVDGYQFGIEFQKGLKLIGCKQVYIDDTLAYYPFADTIINHAPGIKPPVHFAHAHLCLGLQYAILRKPFFAPVKPKNYRSPVAFVSLGGSDYFGFTLRICNILLAIGHFNLVHILCTTGFEESSLEQLRKLEIEGKVALHFNLSAAEIVGLMNSCTHAFVSASTVLLESYFRGLICFAGYYSNNQLLIYNGFMKEELAFAMGDLNNVTQAGIAGLIRLSESNVKKDVSQIIGTTNGLTTLFESMK